MFPFSWEFHHPNWRSLHDFFFFGRVGLKPPTSTEYDFSCFRFHSMDSFCAWPFSDTPKCNIYIYHNVSSCIPLSIYICICIHSIYTYIHFNHTYCSICIPKYLNYQRCGMMFWDEFYPIDYFARGVTLGPWQVSWAVTVGRTRYKLGHLGERNRDCLVNKTPILLWFMIHVTDCNCSIHGVKLHPLIAGGPTLWVE